MEKNKKKKIKIISIAAAVLAVIILLNSLIAVNLFRIESELLYYVMPDSIEMDLSDGSTIEVFKRKNKNYDYKTQKDSPLAAYQFYCYDENGNELSVDGDKPLVINEETQAAPGIMFIVNSADKVNQVKKVATIVILLVTAVVIIGLIILWYKIWSKKQDEEKERKYGNKNETKQKKKKK